MRQGIIGEGYLRMDTQSNLGNDREIYNAVLQLARRQEEALRQGSITEFSSLMGQRSVLFSQLSATDPEAGEDSEVSNIIKEILRVDSRNAVRLRVITEETAREASDLLSVVRQTQGFSRRLLGNWFGR